MPKETSVDDSSKALGLRLPGDQGASNEDRMKEMEIRSLRVGRLEGIVVAFIPQRPFRGSGTSRYDSDVHVSTGHTLFTNWTMMD